MNTDDICSRLGKYLSGHCEDLPISETRARVFQLAELTKVVNTNTRVLGTIRKRFTQQLAQDMTPGQNPEFVVVAQSCYGRAAIAVRRIRNSPESTNNTQQG